MEFSREKRLKLFSVFEEEHHQNHPRLPFVKSSPFPFQIKG